MGIGRRRHQDSNGFTTAVSVLSVAVGLVITAILLVVSLDQFGGASNGGSGGQSILSRSSAESQIKLCAEGRASTYGDPPTQAQQAHCLDQLAGQLAGSGDSLPGVP